MAVGVASSTAVLVCQGRATAEGRYAVGRFSDPVSAELLDPAERAVVDRVRRGDVPAQAAERMAYEMVRRSGITMVPRTVAIDTVIREHGAPQLVILGAGLDARAWRMPELAQATVFEVDHPASQRDKLRRIGGRTRPHDGSFPWRSISRLSPLVRSCPARASTLGRSPPGSGRGSCP